MINRNFYALVVAFCIFFMNVFSSKGQGTVRLVLGFSAHTETVDLESFGISCSCPKGLLVPTLFRQLPIYEAGLRPGDVLTLVDGQCFSDLEGLSQYIKTKKDKKISLEFYDDKTAKSLESELVTLEEYEEINKVFVSKGRVGVDGKFSIDAKVADAIKDRGSPYKYYRCEAPSKKMHWDIFQYRNLEEAKELAKKEQKPIIMALFGSHNCCSTISLSEAHYEKLLSNVRIQSKIKSNFVSILVLKPEAYSAFKDFELQADLPTLMVLNEAGLVQKTLVLKDKTTENKLEKFLSKMSKK